VGQLRDMDSTDRDTNTESRQNRFIQLALENGDEGLRSMEGSVGWLRDSCTRVAVWFSKSGCLLF